MSGVYCKDCKHFERPGFEGDGYYWKGYCKAASKKEIIKDYIFGNYTKVTKVLIDAPDYPNKRDTNGCTLYKQKWWKFWIKEKTK